MALVDYSDSEPSDDASSSPNSRHTTTLKRKRSDHSAEPDRSAIGPKLPPLPAEFHDLYASTSRVSTQDDPSLHGGRKRVIPHVEGNWPTHIYLEWHPTYSEFEQLSLLLKLVQNKASATGRSIRSLLLSDLGAPLPLHISLSRPVVLITEHRHSFVEKLAKDIASSGTRPFDVEFTALDWVANYENTRWFLVLRLTRPSNNGLNRLIHITNKTLASFGQPPLYSESKQTSRLEVTRASGPGRAQRADRGRRKVPITTEPKPNEVDFSTHFHISLGWTLEAPSPEMIEQLCAKDITAVLDEWRGKVKVKFDVVKAKIGNTVTAINLPTKAGESGGLIGY
ncbi:hypothetical protein L228DRAFT_257616 [Xylona heveae TC161]|uniref:U6 snRNA phosphodiesterase n=1 Tax=Xylona heveae (strain CBS 132557 / TC161) TaxID=1328760 RepID=A0A165JEC4_XYLHT|nr:hypothetical protein L228DRAFT_257616 [Xylona heveae TC161]KZF26128.1 hypothetical protein L228DRAFT_257616 [Xylona heveae TC161]